MNVRAVVTKRCVQVAAPLLSGDRINDIRTRPEKIRKEKERTKKRKKEGRGGEREREREKRPRVDRNKSGDVTGDKTRKIVREVAL